MKHIVALYTGHGLAPAVMAECEAQIPGVRLTNIIDDSLIRDVRDAGGMSPAIARRLIHYFEIAREAGASVILNTCSSVGEIVAQARPFLDVPIVRIDEPMAREAVDTARRIGVLATIPTTLAPTVRLLREMAEQRGRDVEIVEECVGGAYDALVAGRPDEHDRQLIAAAERLRPRVQLIVLAQGSMARIATHMREATGLPVLSSIRSGVAEVRRILEQ